VSLRVTLVLSPLLLRGESRKDSQFVMLIFSRIGGDDEQKKWMTRALDEDYDEMRLFVAGALLTHNYLSALCMHNRDGPIIAELAKVRA